MLRYQIFLRDAEAIDAMSSAHEVCINCKHVCVYDLGEEYDFISMFKSFCTKFIYCSSLQVYLSGDELGNSVDEVDGLLKKHETFEKLLVTQEEKVLAMSELANQLITNEHFAVLDIKQKQQAVINRCVYVCACVCIVSKCSTLFVSSEVQCSCGAVDSANSIRTVLLRTTSPGFVSRLKCLNGTRHPIVYTLGGNSCVTAALSFALLFA